MKQIPGLLVVLTILFFFFFNSSTSEAQRMEEALKRGEIMYHYNENLDTFIPELDKASAYFASKKQYCKAAQAALYFGYCEMEHDKESAMESLGRASYYGSNTRDSLTVARAQYLMGQLLYAEGTENEALKRFRNAEEYFGSNNLGKALAENMMACCKMVLFQLDSAAYYLRKSLENADQADSNDARSKALNNFAILYRLKGESDKAISYLRLIKTENEQKKLLYHLNLGNIFADLQKIDNEYSNIVDKNNRQRLLRGIEVKLSTGKSILDFWKEKKHNIFEKDYFFEKYIVSLERDMLYSRINSRVDAMLKAGLLEEMEKVKYIIMEQNIQQNQLPKAIGLNHLLDYLNGKITLNIAIDLMKKDSRHYAKRQMTWWRNYHFDKVIAK